MLNIGNLNPFGGPHSSRHTQSLPVCDWCVTPRQVREGYPAGQRDSFRAAIHTTEACVVWLCMWPFFVGTDISSTCMNFKSRSHCKVTRQLADWGIVSRAFMTLLILPFQTWMKYAVRNLEKPGLPVVYPSYQPPMSGQKYVYDLSDLSVFFYPREWDESSFIALNPLGSTRLFDTSIRIHWWLNGVLCHPVGYWWQPHPSSLPMMVSINGKS